MNLHTSILVRILIACLTIVVMDINETCIAESAYTSHHLSNGVIIDIPAGWYETTDEYLRTLEAATEATVAADKVARIGSLLLIAVLMDADGREMAHIRVRESSPTASTWSQANVRQFDNSFLEKLGGKIRANSEVEHSRQGNKLIGMTALERTAIGQCYFLSYEENTGNINSPSITRYRRELQFHAVSRIISFTVSWDASIDKLIRPISQRVVSSIKVRPYC